MLVVEELLKPEDREKAKKLKNKLFEINKKAKFLTLKMKKLKIEQMEVMDQLDNMFDDFLSAHKDLNTERIVFDLKMGVVLIDDESIIGE